MIPWALSAVFVLLCSIRAVCLQIAFTQMLAVKRVALCKQHTEEMELKGLFFPRWSWERHILKEPGKYFCSAKGIFYAFNLCSGRPFCFFLWKAMFSIHIGLQEKLITSPAWNRIVRRSLVLMSSWSWVHVTIKKLNTWCFEYLSLRPGSVRSITGML